MGSDNFFKQILSHFLTSSGHHIYIYVPRNIHRYLHAYKHWVCVYPHVCLHIYTYIMCCSVLQCAAVSCSLLQCVAVWYRVLQCVAVCCSELQCGHNQPPLVKFFWICIPYICLMSFKLYQTQLQMWAMWIWKKQQAISAVSSKTTCLNYLALILVKSFRVSLFYCLSTKLEPSCWWGCTLHWKF